MMKNGLEPIGRKKVLLAGHFSTIGDIESLELVQEWLRELKVPYVVVPFSESVRNKLSGSRDIQTVNPAEFSHLVMVCGPVWKDQLGELGFDLSKFQHCVRIGVNLTLITPLNIWNPFDVLLERDSDRGVRPDLTSGAPMKTVPVVVGRCMVRRQLSYEGREKHDLARELFDRAIDRHDLAVLDLDTRWYRDQNGLKSPAQFLAALQRVDLLLTNRLHGMVYALKAGVPVVAIDAIQGGAKVLAQAKAIGWPQCRAIDQITPDWLDAAIEWCLSPQAQDVMAGCRQNIQPELKKVKEAFMSAMSLAGERVGQK